MRQQNKLPFFALFFLLSTSTFVVSVLSVGSSINDASILISEEKGKRPLEMVNNSEEGGQTSRLHYQRVEDNETPRLPNTYFKKKNIVNIVKMNSGELKYLKGVVVRARNSKKVKFSGCSALIHAAFGVDLTENNKRRRSIKRNFIKLVDSGGLKKGELSRKSKNGGMILLDKDSTSFEKALYFGGPFVDISRDLKEENCDLKLEDLKENELELMRLIVEFTCPVWRRTGYHNEAFVYNIMNPLQFHGSLSCSFEIDPSKHEQAVPVCKRDDNHQKSKRNDPLHLRDSAQLRNAEAIRTNVETEERFETLQADYDRFQQNMFTYVIRSLDELRADIRKVQRDVHQSSRSRYEENLQSEQQLISSAKTDLEQRVDEKIKEKFGPELSRLNSAMANLRLQHDVYKGRLAEVEHRLELVQRGDATKGGPSPSNSRRSEGSGETSTEGSFYYTGRENEFKDNNNEGEESAADYKDNE